VGAGGAEKHRPPKPPLGAGAGACLCSWLCLLLLPVIVLCVCSCARAFVRPCPSFCLCGGWARTSLCTCVVVALLPEWGVWWRVAPALWALSSRSVNRMAAMYMITRI
jgi:hypothetical protein